MIDDISKLYQKILEEQKDSNNKVQLIVEKELHVNGNNDASDLDEGEPFDDFLLKLGEKIQEEIQEEKETVPENISEDLNEDVVEISEKDTFGDFLLKLGEKIQEEIEEKETVPENISEDSNEDVVEISKEDKNNYVNELKKIDKPHNKKVLKENEELTNIISEQIQDEIGKVKTQISRMAIEGGGGSVAVQYANGGTMNGDLNVTGKYLSGGVDLSTLIGSGGGGGGLSGTTDRLVSGSQLLKLNSDGTIDFPSNTITPQDETILTLESTKLLDNYYNRLALSPYGFFASDHNGNSLTINSIDNEILIDSQNTYFWKFNNKGALEGPFGTLSVSGNLSASNVVYASGGNSDLWNSTYTTVSSNSANWQGLYTTVQTNSSTWVNAISAQTMLARVYNADSVTMNKGDVVYTFGANGDVMSVKLASNVGDPTSSRTLGFVNETIVAGGIGYVVIAGQIDKMSFPHPFQEGDILWLGETAGTFTRIEPTAPNHAVYLGVVERANNGNGLAYVKVQNGLELRELHDVLITNVSAGDVLQRNAANTLWVNTPLSADKWNSTYTTVNSNSANWGTGGGTSLSTVINYLSTNNVLLSSAQIGSQTESTTLFVRGQKVGINTNSPNQTLTVVGNVSSTGLYYGDGSQLTGIVAGDTVATTLVRTNSSNWESTYTTVQNNSATNWNYQGTDIKAISGNWQSTYTTVQSNSATWGTGGGTSLSTVINYLSTNNVLLSSAQIGSQTESTILSVRNQKVGINTNSPNQVLTVVGNVSSTGLYYGDGSQLTGIIAGDTVATTLVRSNSANWELSPSVYTTVNSNSATTWNYQGTDIKNISANWESTYTTVQSNSATWETGGTDLTTVLDYLSTNNIFLSSAQIGPQEQTTSTLFARGYKVGVNTETPNEALTVVGNVSSTGLYYGDGSNLTGIVAGDTVATTLVRTNSANWELAPSAYTTVNSNSANWESTYNTVQSNSATNWDNSLVNQYTHTNFLPITGGDLTGPLTTTSTISSSETISASGARVITGRRADAVPVYHISVLTQIEYNAIELKDDNTLYFIKE